MLMTFVHMRIEIPWIRLSLRILLRIADTVLPLIKVDRLISTRLGRYNVRWIPQQRSWLKIWQVAFTSGGYCISIAFSFWPQVREKDDVETLLNHLVLGYNARVVYWAPAFDTNKTRRSNDLEIRSAPAWGTDKLGNNTSCCCWWLIAARCSRVGYCQLVAILQQNRTLQEHLRQVI